MKKSITVWVRAVIFSLGIAVVFFLGTELLVEVLLDNPSACPGVLLPTLRRYHEYFDRDIFQADKQRTHYDDTLFYALNPGKFGYKSREFDNDFDVNSAGFRDDEASLIRPEIVVLGDSYTMGWGVDQHEVYPALIEEGTGLSVLNTGVSSYGTAREIESLARVDTQAMDYLIIQYSPNDLAENQNFFANKHSLRVSSKSMFDEACRANEERIAGFPFKNSILMLRLVGQRLRGDRPVWTSVGTESAARAGAAEAFLDVVKRSEHIPKHTQIVVFALEAEKADSGFVELVAARLEQNSGSSLHDRMSFIDLTGLLDNRHRFILDPHLNAKGHRVVADQVIKHIGHLERLTGPKEWFYPSGARSITCQYVDGLKDGKFTAYWPSGEVSRTSWFERGSKEGLEVDFDRDGQTIRQRTYRDGQPFGWSTTFDADGGVIERVYYERGLVVENATQKSQ